MWKIHHWQMRKLCDSCFKKVFLKICTSESHNKPFKILKTGKACTKIIVIYLKDLSKNISRLDGRPFANNFPVLHFQKKNLAKTHSNNN
jgi:hypothetical protein